ncbi:MAG: methylated-DNA--[protein]-cysteine S-methyltransferase [Candidatus Sericytochromatia bacterium]|nr:methylated-DNA--[protein]-cysteine S-methyltransferase [Candidatus Tanganyikabacteria bacterium]
MAEPGTLYTRRIETPVGPLLLGLTSRGLATILFGPDALAPDEVLRSDFARLEPARGEADAAAAQLAEYFAGRRREFALPLDLRGTPFRREVWSALQAVPYGQTRSYLELARLTGRRGGARAVGQAVRHNPVPIVVPCHRVIAADGGLGGYGGRWAESGQYADIKRALLQLERR